MDEDKKDLKRDRFSVGIRVTQDDIVRALKIKLTQNPDDAQSHKELGFILSDEKYEKKDLQEAKDHLKKAIELGVDGLDVRLKLGDILLKIGNYEEAEFSYRKAIEFDSRCAEGYRGLGISLYHLKKYPEAKISLQKALELQKELKTYEVNKILAEIHISLAKVAFESKEYEECKKECQSALELKPDFVQGYIWLGNIHYARGDYRNAQKMFEEAININPNDYEPHYYLGLILERLNRPDEAEKEYKRAIGLTKNFPEAHCKLGLLLKSQKRFVEAVLELEEAIRLKPDLIEAQESLRELTSQPPEKVKEAKENAEKVIKDAELLIKEMEDWHCQNVEGYKEAINEFNRAKDLIKAGYYYAYQEASSSAEKSIEIAKRCINNQKSAIQLNFSNMSDRVEALLRLAENNRALEYFPEEYEKLAETFSSIWRSFQTAKSYEKQSSLLGEMSQLVQCAKSLRSKSWKKFMVEKQKEESWKRRASENSKMGAKIGSAIGGITGFIHCCVLIGRNFDNAIGAWILHACVGVILGALIGYFTTPEE